MKKKRYLMGSDYPYLDSDIASLKHAYGIESKAYVDDDGDVFISFKNKRDLAKARRLVGL